MTKARLVTTSAVVLPLVFAAGFLQAQFRGPGYYTLRRVVHWIKPYAPSDNVQFAPLAALYRASPIVAPISIVGDSHVAYADWPRLLRRSDVQAKGIPGDPTSALRARIEGGEPMGSTVVVMIGVNDVQSDITPAETRSNFAAILDRLRGKRIIVVSPMLTSSPPVNARVRKIIEVEREECGRRRCVFMDINPLVTDGTIMMRRFTVDGVHLSVAGYSRIAQALATALSS